MNHVLEDILRTGTCVDAQGKERKVTGAVPREDAVILQEMVRFVKAKTALETGVAFGVSTLAICDALDEPGAKLYGVDPEQSTVHGNAALENLRRAGLDNRFELLKGPSHLMLPRLLEKGVVLDFAFIDGWHTFDYTLLDFFYIDKMLRPGGVVLLHDRSWPSKQKVMRFIKTHRKYRELPVRGKRGQSPGAPASDLARYSPRFPGFFKWLRRVVAAKWHWLGGAPFGTVTAALLNRPEVAAFLKLEQFEPDHRFFKRF